jgi:hypothetical protein
MKKENGPKSDRKDKAYAEILNKNHKLICANILLLIAKLGLIKLVG